MGDDLVPDELTHRLGCQPTYAQTKGEELVGKKTGFVRIAKFGMWQLAADERGPEDIDGQIVELLGKLPASLDVWSEMSKRFEMDLFCGLFMEQSNEGMSISAPSLAALGSRGIDLQLDIYGSTDEEAS
jgi:hypothetical protein